MTIDEVISNIDGVLSDIETSEDENSEVVLSDVTQPGQTTGSKSVADESGLDCAEESTKTSEDEVLSEGSSESDSAEVLLSDTQQTDLNTGSKSATNEAGSNYAEDNSAGEDGVLSDDPQSGQITGPGSATSETGSNYTEDISTDEVLSDVPQQAPNTGSESATDGSGSDTDELLSGIPQTYQTAGSKSEDTHDKANVSNPNNRAWFTDSIGSKSDDDYYFVGEEINEADGIVQLREPVLSVRTDEKPFDLYNPCTFWTDTPDANGFTLSSVVKLLDEEAVRLTGAKFVLGGINFLSDYRTESDAIKGIRYKSVLALKSAGKTYTQDRIDKKRALDAKSAAREKAASEAAFSKNAKQLLSWQFSTGVLSADQYKELCEAEIINPALLESKVPTVAEIYEKLDRGHMADGIAGKSKTSYTVETVARYDDYWNQLNSDICSGEYGRCSYWIAAGGNWLVGEYITATLKTAFAAGLTVVPAASLTELRSIFDKSHNYLNDLELHCSVPRAMRDTLEQFALFNAAYTAIYEGAASKFSPNSNRLKKQYHWRSYLLSDVVIIMLPAYGVLTGGLEALGELLLYRGEAGKSTVIVSNRSLRDIQELNNGILSDFFNRTGISAVKREDACMLRGCGVNDFIYFSVHGDASERGGDAQLGKKIAEAKATIAKMGNSTSSSTRSTRNKKPSKTVGSSTVARKKASAEKGAPE